jgi:non-ribosomal peptide synthetase component F
MPQLPTLSLHGTSPESLLEDYQRVLTAVSNAIDVLRHDACPNPRDYPAEAFLRAQNEHRERMERLHDMHGDLEAIAIHAADAVCAKADRQRAQAQIG